MNVGKTPIVIGALGGSGTRVFVRIARHAGIFMGSRLNDAVDSQPLEDFYAVWTRPYLRSGGRLPDEEQKPAAAMFFDCLGQHLSGLPAADAPWGIKVPKSILMNRFWRQVFPDLKFIDVIRGGLDMAYSADSNELDAFGDLVLNQEEQDCSRRLQAMAYWQRVNFDAADFGETHLGEHYLGIRFEDLCAEPARTVRQIFDFLEVSDRSSLAAAVSEVSDPHTLGRWRARPAEEVYEIMLAGRTGLERFGYWNPFIWRGVERAAKAPRWRRWLLQRFAMRNLPAW